MSDGNKFEKAIREKQKKDGFFDGRFQEKVFKNGVEDFEGFDLEEELALYEELYKNNQEREQEDERPEDELVHYQDEGF